MSINKVCYIVCFGLILMLCACGTTNAPDFYIYDTNTNIKDNKEITKTQTKNSSVNNNKKQKLKKQNKNTSKKKMV